MSTVFHRAAEARFLVGYLAEQRASWFTSQFFGPRSAAFLSPVFSRTAFQAQCNGVTAAAARLHDEVVGVGKTHHLFRLPEGLEHGIADAFSDASFISGLQGRLGSTSSATVRLEQLSIAGTATDGAVSLAGDFGDGTDAVLKAMAGLYADAFRRGIRTFPFVREI